MELLVTIVFTTVALVEIQGRNVIPGRQVPNDPSFSKQLLGQQSDVVLYLTPSEMRQFQEDQSSIYPQGSQSDSNIYSQSQVYPQIPVYEQNEYLHPHQSDNVRPPLEYPQPNQMPINEQPWKPIAPTHHHQPEAGIHNTFQPQKKERVLKPIPFFPELDKQTIINNVSKAVPESKQQEPVQEIDYDNEVTRQKIKEKWLQILKQNIAHYKLMQSISQKQQQSYENKTNFHYASQNGDGFNVQRDASDVYNLVRSNNENQLKRQRIKIQAESIANAPPARVNEEVIAKHTPEQFIAQRPVSSPEFLHAESYEVNVPQAYETPLDILRTVRIPNVNTQTGNVNRPAPAEVEMHIPFPATNNEYGGFPYSMDHVIPRENQTPSQESRQIHSHVWHH